MENKEKIKIVWVCSFSNPTIREHIRTKSSLLKRMVYHSAGKYSKNSDSAIWNTNGIREFEKIDDVELHVICPVRDLCPKVQKMSINGINYYFFREENSSTFRFVFHQLFTKHTSKYKKNRRYISEFIYEIQPEIVHVIGAENPHYSLALLDVPKEIPTILQLQALLTRVVSVTKDPKAKESYYYKGLNEQLLIKKANFVGTSSVLFSKYIRKNIKPDVTILRLPLAMANDVSISEEPKQFDFVYFSASIRKAGAEALEAFIIAQKSSPNITLDIIGNYDDEFKSYLDKLIKENGIEHLVTFEGLLPTHDDVITQIRKARFALLPIKIDLVPNTLHEAMSNGLPVITTVTDGTPLLNVNQQCVLLSDQGDYSAMAKNMLRLLSDKQLASELMENALAFEKSRRNNRDVMLRWRDAYYACLESFKDNTPIPDDLLLVD